MASCLYPHLQREDSADFTRTFRALAKLKPAAISQSAAPAEARSREMCFV